MIPEKETRWLPQASWSLPLAGLAHMPPLCFLLNPGHQTELLADSFMWRISRWTAYSRARPVEYQCDSPYKLSFIGRELMLITYEWFVFHQAASPAPTWRRWGQGFYATNCNGSSWKNGLRRPPTSSVCTEAFWVWPGVGHATTIRMSHYAFRLVDK